MTDGRFERIEDLFRRAKDLDPEERAAYLDGACGDDVALRGEVEALLARDQSPHDALRTPALGKDIKQAAVRFEAYDIHKAIDEGGEAMIKEGTFTNLEKLCDDALMEFVKQAKYITFGLEPMIAYLISRQMEIKCIRILMGRKAVGTDPQVIRERMRETYE